MKIDLNSDKVSIRGPSVDGGFKVTFDVGEHEQLNVAKLLAIPQQTNLIVSVIITEEERL